MHTRFITVVLLLIAATLTVIGYDAPHQPQKIAAPGIVNYSEIRGDSGFAGVFVGFGGATPPAAMSWLKDRGFATIINLRLAIEDGADVEGCRTAANAVGIRYLSLPFDPEKNADPGVVDSILGALADHNNQPIYIHCNSATRVGALWMIGRVLKDGRDIDAAAKECELIALKPQGAIAYAKTFLNTRHHDK